MAASAHPIVQGVSAAAARVTNVKTAHPMQSASQRRGWGGCLRSLAPLLSRRRCRRSEISAIPAFYPAGWRLTP
jgi:hypothetical protein